MSGKTRDQAWADLRAFFGSEPYKAVISYLEAEEALAIERLVGSADHDHSCQCRGEVRILRMMASNLKRVQLEPEKEQ